MPEESGDSSERDKAPALGATEESVAAIWRELIGVSHIRSSDTFFDLGGHSLLAVRAVREMERRLGVSVELRRLIFESLAQIADSLATAAPAPQPIAERDNEPADEPSATGGVSRWLGRLKSIAGGR